MLDFKELSKDGTDLERLTREIFIREGFETHWTGKGSDGGRDLLVIEKVQGPLSKFERKWLVQCKHKAHSGQSIGKDAANSLVTDCKRVGATGYLMVCTTSLTSGLIKAYEELMSMEGIVIDYWDEVRLEDRLLKPCNFSLIDQFFPISSRKVGWKIYNTYSPSFWSAHYKRAFLYLSSRLSMHFPTVTHISKIYDYVQEVYQELDLGIRGLDLQLRGIYYDDKNTNYMAFVDFLADERDAPKNPFESMKLKEDIIEVIEDYLPSWVELDGGGVIPLMWDVKVYFEKGYSSDGYDVHGKEFYTPYIENFKYGIRRS
jgi:hypothetical protein